MCIYIYIYIHIYRESGIHIYIYILALPALALPDPGRGTCCVPPPPLGLCHIIYYYYYYICIVVKLCHSYNTCYIRNQKLSVSAASAGGAPARVRWLTRRAGHRCHLGSGAYESYEIPTDATRSRLIM